MQLLRGVGSLPAALALVLGSGVFAMTGCGSSNSSGSGTNVTSTPTLNPSAGTYNTSQAVVISDQTPGAVLYCTTDGTPPTPSSPQCSQPVTVFKTEFLQVLAVAPGKESSAIVSAGYTINLNAAATPTFSPAGGTYTTAQNVTISDTTSGANIYYTTDGSVPTASSTLYTGPVAIAKNATLSAIAVASGFANSSLASANYTIQTQAALTPTIANLSPASAAAGSAAFTLTVNGANFDSSATVQWGGTALPTTYVSATQLTVAVPASLIAAAGTSNVAVTEAEGTSPAAAFVINPGVPMIANLSPASATAGSGDLTLTVNGTNFLSGATVQWGSTALPTTYVSATQLTATVPASLIAATGNASVTVTDIGGTSTGAAFTISAGVPSITSLTPVSAAAGGANFTLTVNGTNFVSGATVQWGSTALTTTYVSGAQLTAAVPASLIATAGTANVTVTDAGGASSNSTFTVATAITGTVASGTGSSLVPLSATVQLYAAGSAGYGQGSTAVGAEVSTDPTTGAFAVAYDCTKLPAPGDQLYLVATGSSTDVALMTALGACGSLGTSGATITINEVTTVASVYALQQFMNETGAVGAASSSASYQGLSNAFKTVGNLVDLAAGQARDHTPAYPTNLAGDSNILDNSTVPQKRINTLANALNACAASGSGCSSLLSATTIGSAIPANTLQAILNIAQNPGSNPTGVFNVAKTSSAFPSPLSAAPNDWTLALTFTGGGLGFAPGTGVPYLDGSGNVGQFLNTAMAIDAVGDIWVTAFNTEPGPVVDFTSGMIARFSNLGAPLTGPSSLSTGGPPTYGGFVPNKFSGSAPSFGGMLAPHGITLDASGNAWVIGGSNSIPPGGATIAEVGINKSEQLTQTQPNIPLANGGISPSPIAIDANGNLWAQSSAGLEVFDNQGNVLMDPNFLNNPDLGINGTNSPFGYGGLESLVFDSNGKTLWASDGNLAGDLFQIDSTANTATVDYFATGTGVYTPLVAGSNDPATNKPGNIYGCATDAQKLNVVNSSSTSFLNNLTIPTGRGCGGQMVMDGAGHIFAVSGAPGVLDEFNAPGVTSTAVTMVSPAATGYTGTSSEESPVINGDLTAPKFVDSPNVTPTEGVTGAAIDESGNLWVLNVDTGTTSSQGNVLVEFVGVAAPVVTPISNALKLGQVGVRP